MRRIRVIPVLLLEGNKVVKSVRFGRRTYIGDPINSVKIFNEKEVDEIIILDIEASKQGLAPDFDRIHGIVSEAFMPVSYGGGISKLSDIQRILASGVEKVVLNSNVLHDTKLIEATANQFGNQSVVVSIDHKKSLFGKPQLYSHTAGRSVKGRIEQFAMRMQEAGAGEIVLNSVDRDGTYKGYDLDTIQMVTSHVDIPVIACGGASGTNDFLQAVKEAKASAVAAGSLFVLKRPHNAVLINFIDQKKLQSDIFEKL